MKTRQQLILVLAMITVFIAMGLFLPVMIGAGDLEPTGALGPTMHTIEEIYTIVSDGCPPSIIQEGIPRTGLTKCYDNIGYYEIPCTGTGQDGEYQKGVAWPFPRFTDNGDGTVTDNLTGLIWLKNANCFGAKSWTDALNDSNNLASGSCGLTDGSQAGDWRLPNVKELISLIHFGYFNPTLPNTAGTGQWTENDPFIDVWMGAYWSSTSTEWSGVDPWCVDINYGYSWPMGQGYNNYVWPVRGGQ